MAKNFNCTSCGRDTGLEAKAYRGGVIDSENVLCSACLNKTPPIARNNVLNQMIASGWDTICEGVREAGKNMIEEPDKVVTLLRGLADSIEKRKGSFDGRQGKRPNP